MQPVLSCRAEALPRRVDRSQATELLGDVEAARSVSRDRRSRRGVVKRRFN